MEQKTEASQAVDAIPTWRERMAEAGLPYPGYKPDSYMDAEIADLRAALKAQPAPTEAPNFCARCGKRLHAGSIHTCTPPGATEAEQAAPTIPVIPRTKEGA